MAAPHVSGAPALLWWATPQQGSARLRQHRRVARGRGRRTGWWCGQIAVGGLDQHLRGARGRRCSPLGQRRSTVRAATQQPEYRRRRARVGSGRPRARRAGRRDSRRLEPCLRSLGKRRGALLGLRLATAPSATATPTQRRRQREPVASPATCRCPSAHFRSRSARTTAARSSTKGFPAGARAERSARLRQHQHHRQRNRRQRRLRASPIVARSHMSGRVAALVRSESLACGRAGDVAWPRVVSGRRQRSHWVGLFRARVGCVSGRFGVSVEVGRGGRQHAPTPRSCRRTRCRM